MEDTFPGWKMKIKTALRNNLTLITAATILEHLV